MTCKNCGSALSEGIKFCTVCGTKVEEPVAFETPVEPVYTAPAEPAYTAPAEPVYTAPVQPTYTAPVEAVYTAPTPKAKSDKLPEQYEPLGPWAYWAYSLLFSVPVVGFIFLIIFSCKNSNINRRNYARSYWCNLIIVGVVLLTMIFLGLLGESVFSEVTETLFDIY